MKEIIESGLCREKIDGMNIRGFEIPPANFNTPYFVYDITIHAGFWCDDSRLIGWNSLSVIIKNAQDMRHNGFSTTPCPSIPVMITYLGIIMIQDKDNLYWDYLCIFVGITEYYEGNDPGKGWTKSRFEQCEMACICGKRFNGYMIVDVKRCSGGIEHITNFLESNKVRYLCDECYQKMGFRLGKLDKVKMR